MDITNNDDIMVSILTLAYNHEPYICECLDGILMQQTNFKFELLIHDDASTDGTANIIREYEKKYPDIIKPIYQKENQYSKNIPIGVTYLYPRVKGKYIALCEGDDFWTDPLKLQKQVDFLEGHPDYVMCSHKYSLCYNESSKRHAALYGDINVNVNYTINDLIEGKWFFQPLSVVFNKCYLNLEEFCRYEKTIDVVLFFHLLKKGKGLMLTDNMGVYRIHKGGSWSLSTMNQKLKVEFETRLRIYSVEHSLEAAIFLKNQFFKQFGRRWLIVNYDLTYKSLVVFLKEFGLIETLRLFVRRMLNSVE